MQNRLRLGPGEIESDAALVTVVGTDHRLAERSDTAGLIAAQALDLDHIRTEIREGLGRAGAGDVLAEVEDSDARKRSTHHTHRPSLLAYSAVMRSSWVRAFSGFSITPPTMPRTHTTAPTNMKPVEYPAAAVAACSTMSPSA